MDSYEEKENRLKKASEEIDRGKNCVMRGDFSSAKTWFKKSMKTLPTAEGYTYYAWMLSIEGDYDQAISLCKKAIDLDRDFGNPYNDIGAYLIAKGQLDESIAWLERAKMAPKYDPRHYPYTNLGRVYLHKGWLRKAKEEFQSALEYAPDHEELHQIIDELERGLN